MLLLNKLPRKEIQMPTYEIEIIHEPTGEYMNFSYEADEVLDEESILSELSVVIIEEVPDEELHQLDLDLEQK